MIINELLSNDKIAKLSFIHLYQQKTEFILFAAITTRPDIAFTVSRLARFNTNSENIHHRVTDQMIQYLYITKDLTLQYENNNQAHSFISVSNISFADNTLNQ